MIVSVVVPVFNEERTVLPLLESVRRVRDSAVCLEVIVVDDGSTDRSRELLESRPDLYDQLCVHPKNRGKGAAVKSGLANATGEILLIQDADLEYDPRDYTSLLRPFQAEEADVVFGRRPKGLESRPFALARRFFSAVTRFLTDLPLTDIAAGYKLFRVEHLRNLSLVGNGFELEPELLIKLARRPGLRFLEVPVIYHPRRTGKKLRWWHGFRYFWAIVRFGVPGFVLKTLSKRCLRRKDVESHHSDPLL
jgi:glycosyltransferase involved in cell wall biosynthesis